LPQLVHKFFPNSTLDIGSFPVERIPCAVSCVFTRDRNDEARIPNNHRPANLSGNRLLGQLTAPEYGRLEPSLERVPLVFNSVLYELGAPIDYIYFPDSGVVSMLAELAPNQRVEVGLSGSEGCAGLGAFLGAETSAYQLIVQAEGTAMRVTREAALAEFRQGGIFHDTILLFTHNLFLQVSQTTSCNRYHSVEERLARWLLMMHDRVPSDSMKLTQGFLSWMLGVRNQALSVGAINLQTTGLIKYRRGTMNILDRKKLEAAACVCYRIIKGQSAYD
jgi:CRP-like cAMP-binding protein